ncbi:S8 family serine peptidase [Myxococcota bacterium]|nr:S8 family serine peptidase [Myxococcota bacterium]
MAPVERVHEASRPGARTHDADGRPRRSPERDRARITHVGLALVLTGLAVSSRDVHAGEPPHTARTPALTPRTDATPTDLDAPRIVRPQTLRTSPPIRGLGPSLARALRRDPDGVHRFAARGLSRADVEAHGGVVTAQLGPILAGHLSGAAIVALAPRAELVESPQPLRLALDLSRAAVGAERADRGDELPQRYRGAGALIAAWDSGVDLSHPDLRALDGPTRVVALWDQTRLGAPPEGQRAGDECTREELVEDRCVQRDTIGHGTHVASIAAGNGPGYRGIAPEADVAIAKTDDFALFFETLAWFDRLATARAQPMIVNLSLGGHLGPHDGTSLEAQAIDAYRHLVVAAAGNEGRIPVHARGTLDDGTRTIVLRFPKYGDRRDVRAWVDVWMEPGAELAVSFVVIEPGGNVIAETATITAGAPGRTDELVLGDAKLGAIDLDAEDGPNPFNGKLHVRATLELTRWQDAPDGPGHVAVRLSGRGTADLWVDTPADFPSLVAFDDAGVAGVDGQLLGDVDSTVSELATAVSALAVSAYSTRMSFPSEGGGTLRAAGTVGALAPFSSHGPSLAPERTGPKPDLAAPGYVVVAARSRDAALVDGAVSPLYRAGAGTSMAAPHVAGVAALIAGARPTVTKLELKQALLVTASRDGVDADPRWGVGKVDAVAALSAVFRIEQGCGCATARSIPSQPQGAEGSHTRTWPVPLLGLALAARRRGRPA